MLAPLPARPYYKPLVVGVGAGVLGVGLWWFWHPSSTPFLTFVRIWCLFQAYAVLVNLAEQMRFYAWWRDSQLSDAHRRGLGTNGFDLFGLIPMPNLSLGALRWVSMGYAGGLLVCALLCEQPYVGYGFVATTVLGLLYFSSLWAERNASYHREYLTVTVLIYFCLTPDFYGAAPASNAIARLIQIHVASIYVAGALQKIACSILAKKPWFMGSPHGFMWRAMWSKPYYPKLQRFMLLHPGLMAASGCVVLLLEAGLSGSFWLSASLASAMVLGLLLFHVGVFFLQGIDYITYWCPALLVWFIVPLGPDASVFQLVDSWSLLPAALFCLAQLVYAFTFLEDFNVNIPPLTCCPMFANVCALNERLPQYYTLWDTRSPIAFERLEWLYPFIKPEAGLGMVASDNAKLPFKFIGFGYYLDPKDFPKLQQAWFHDDLVKEEGFFLFANFDVSPQLSSRLRALTLWLHEEKANTSIFDTRFLEEAWARYKECCTMFESEVQDHYLKSYQCTSALETRAVYDQWAPTYDQHMTELGWQAPVQIAELLSSSSPPSSRPSARVLDVGAGTGLCGLALKSQGFGSIDALDVSSGMLALAEQRKVYDRTLVGDVQASLPIPSHAYDAVVCVGALNFGHIAPSALQQMARMTKTSGHICFSTREDYYQKAARKVQEQLVQSGRLRLVEMKIRPTAISDMVHRHWLYQVL